MTEEESKSLVKDNRKDHYETIPKSYQQSFDLEGCDDEDYLLRKNHSSVIVEDREGVTTWEKKLLGHKLFVGSCAVLGILSMVFLVMLTMTTPSPPLENAAWASKAAPFSTVDPTDLGFIAIDRYDISKPGLIFGDLLTRQIPLPTNSWYENFLLGFSNTDPENKVFQVPYVLDTAGPIPGMRTHATHVQANSRAIMVSDSLQSRLLI